MTEPSLRAPLSVPILPSARVRLRLPCVCQPLPRPPPKRPARAAYPWLGTMREDQPRDQKDEEE